MGPITAELLMVRSKQQIDVSSRQIDILEFFDFFSPTICLQFFVVFQISLNSSTFLHRLKIAKYWQIGSILKFQKSFLIFINVIFST